ncbi:hypothetical protein SERLA73DRAFT_189139 [Serpula lacrymans var. lacrymans S7.3]|uniref:Uncharacterized protein n=1 Tax=Serpula lacrymans var. lacrymans (strain S7.3) TaxID=936435 RepID=F8QCX2_SERL3|nr:hypothetical protein SERLA73DRAFT_189139 [Serpula lacrymans var. lacrymans S7.3]
MTRLVIVALSSSFEFPRCQMSYCNNSAPSGACCGRSSVTLLVVLLYAASQGYTTQRTYYDRSCTFSPYNQYQYCPNIYVRTSYIFF